MHDVTKVQFDRNEDAYGGVTPAVTITFKNGERIMLFSFGKKDINAILERIKEVAPNVDDQGTKKEMSEYEVERNDWKSAFRPGDRFIFTAGAFFVILAIIWWLIQKFWFT